MKRAVGLVLVSIGCTLAASSWAVANYVLEGDETETPVSGTRDAAPGSLGELGDYYAIIGIEMFEDRGEPCGVRSYSSHLNDGNTRMVASGVTASCNDAGRRIVFGEADTFVRGIEVCHSDDGVVKGVRLFGARLDRDSGRLRSVLETPVFTRPACRGWMGGAQCPAGKIASRIEVHRNPLWDIIGYSLICETPMET